MNKMTRFVVVVMVMLWLVAGVVPALGQEETPTPTRTQGGEEIATEAVVILPVDAPTLEQQINTELSDSLTDLASKTADQATFNLMAVITGFVAFGLAALAAVYKSVPPEVGRGILKYADTKLETLKARDLIPGTQVDDALIAYISERFDVMQATLERPATAVNAGAAPAFRGTDDSGVG